VGQKIAVVTGGSRGIGKAIVERLAADGYRVWTCSRKIDEQERCRLENAGINYAECDLKDDKSVQAFAGKVLSAGDDIGLLVNNAGVSIVRNGVRTLAHNIGIEQWQAVIETNLSGAFRMCVALIPAMLRRRAGCIVNISSASARIGGIAASVDYISSKAGLIGLTKGLAFELGPFGVRVVAICPGRIRTEMLNGIPGVDEWVKAHVPLGRLGEAADVAALVSHLASPEAAYITGATIDCNGGWVIT
jgi:3-oxoacyl-[acyl-carrier protein] reductase